MEEREENKDEKRERKRQTIFKVTRENYKNKKKQKDKISA